MLHGALLRRLIEAAAPFRAAQASTVAQTIHGSAWNGTLRALANAPSA
jgi:hypothetical protein